MPRGTSVIGIVGTMSPNRRAAVSRGAAASAARRTYWAEARQSRCAEAPKPRQSRWRGAASGLGCSGLLASVIQGSQLAAAGGRLSFGKTGRRLEVRSSFRMLIEVHQCLLHSGPKKPPFDNPVAKAERQEVVRFDP